MAKKGTLVPRDAAEMRDRVLSQIGEYVFANADASNSFAKRQGDHLFIGVEEQKFILRPVLGTSDLKPLAFICGLYSLDELLNLSIDRPEAVIDDLLYQGELMLLAGRPKVGKSRLVHQMAVALSEGSPFLGMKVAHSRRVLLVDLENKPWAIKDRLARMAGNRTAANHNVFIWCSDTMAENSIDFSTEGTARLEKILDETGAEVLIIDAWRLWLGGDENNADDVVRGLKALSALRKIRPWLSIIVVHHVRKERFESPAKLMKDPSLWVENISGHYALVGHVDACFGLERQEHDGEEIVIFGGIARNVEPRSILLSDDPDSLRFDVVETEGAAKIAMTPKEWDLWGQAKKQKSFTWTDFLEVSGTTNRKLLSSMLKKAESHGLIEKTGKLYRIK